MNRKLTSEDAVIVGGGVIGLSIAWQLAKEGWKVTILERDDIGQGTSWAGAGILPPANFSAASDPIDRLRGLSHKLFPTWSSELKATTGLDPGLRRCGGWYLAESLGELASLVGMADYWAHLDIESERLPMRELVKHEPALSSWAKQKTSIGAWWVPDEYQLCPPLYLRCLQTACEEAGVLIRTQCELEGVRAQSDMTCVRFDGRWHDCSRVVLCGGAWLNQFTEPLGLSHSVIPVRGQMLLLKTVNPISRRIINLGNRYLVCREDGHILIGSCEEEVGYQLGTTDEMISELRSFANSLIPALVDAEHKRSWSGLRPMTYDGFPMIGRVPGTNNAYVAGGHFRSGLHLSTGTASVLCDLMVKREPLIDLDAFRVGKQISHRQTHLE